MKTKFKIIVTLTLDEAINGTKEERYAMTRNIAEGIERQANNVGLNLDDSVGIVTEIKVRPEEDKDNVIIEL